MSANKKKQEYTLQDKTKTFLFEGFEYTLEFGNTGNIMKTALLRTKLSDGELDRLMRFPTQDAKLTANLIDLEAILLVYCPQFFEDRGINSIKELDFIKGIELEKIYREEIFEWFSFWDEVMKDPEKYLPNSYVNKTKEAAKKKPKQSPKRKKITTVTDSGHSHKISDVTPAVNEDSPTIQGEPIQGLEGFSNS